MPEKKVLYVGFDESNNDKAISVYVSVSSYLTMNKKKTERLSKRRGSHEGISERLNKRDYTFLIVQKHDSARISRIKFPGVIMASLLEGKVDNSLTALYLFLDGKLEQSPKMYARNFISDCYSISRKKIYLEAGAKFDKKYRIINLADELAHYLASKNSSLIDFSLDEHLRFLIR